jgi:HEAT repeat protein
MLDLPEDATSCEALLAATEDPSLDVARKALARLARLGGEQEAESLRARLLEVDLGLVPDFAATLRALGDGDAAAVARRGLADPSPTVRIAAALALRELRDPDSAPALRRAARDPVAGVRRFALEALGNLGRGAENGTTCVHALKDPDPEVRAAAVRMLGKIAAHPDARLRSASDDPAPSVRRELARLSSRLGDALVRSLVVEDPDADVRAAALWRLVDAPRASLFGACLAGADDPEWRVRWAAVRALGAVRDERGKKRLLSSLLDRHEKVRAAAARALGEIFGPRLADALASELSTPDPALRRALVYRLAEIGTEDAIASILEREIDESPEVREALAHALAETDASSAIPALERLAGDTDMDVRAAAQTALHRLQTDHAR